jgi:hypothetical protein
MSVNSGESSSDEVALLSTAEAIAEVRRWLEAEGVDPDTVFLATPESTIRYRDLIPHLEQETADGALIRFAISRGRSLGVDRRRSRGAPLQILPTPEETQGDA